MLKGLLNCQACGVDVLLDNLMQRVHLVQILIRQVGRVQYRPGIEHTLLLGFGHLAIFGSLRRVADIRRISEHPFIYGHIRTLCKVVPSFCLQNHYCSSFLVVCYILYFPIILNELKRLSHIKITVYLFVGFRFHFKRGISVSLITYIHPAPVTA